MGKQETKRERFLRLAKKRVDKTIDSLRILGNLSNKSVYEYTDEDIEQMFEALDQVIVEVKAGFKSTQKNSEGFTFDKEENDG